VRDLRCPHPREEYEKAREKEGEESVPRDKPLDGLCPELYKMTEPVNSGW